MGALDKNQVDTVRTIAALREKVAEWRRAGETVALVPTMGALHEGHVSLMRSGQDSADRLVVSIFVNPTQFGAGEDLDAYPRTEAADLEKLAAVGADLAYCPGVSEIYSDGFATRINVEGLEDELCGASRVGHFSGVATIVAKLLLQAMPDVAVFGEKDYQQLLIIRRMVRDLDIPVEILSGATVREADGLALSSRNAYLTPEERNIAPLLHKIMLEMADALMRGDDAADVVAAARQKLEKAGFAIDYLELRDGGTLAPVTGKITGVARIFAAVRLGKTRLIDNIAIKGR